MGLFDFLGFTANNDTSQDESSSSTPPLPPQSTIRKHDESSFPVVVIKRAKPHVNGNRVQIYCLIANTWPEEVELDKIIIFNTKRELDTVLRGHEERDFLVYDGPALTHEYHEAELIYKAYKEDDYFKTVHKVRYTYRPEDRTYIVGDIHLHEPVRDIYE